MISVEQILAAPVDDAEARRQGIGFIDGSIPGYALLLGEDGDGLVSLVESLRRKQIAVFVLSDSLAATLEAAGLSLGWDSRVIHREPAIALGCIARLAQIFGNATSPEEVLDYARRRLRGFTVILGQPSPEDIAIARAALTFGCPLLSTGDVESAATDRDGAVIGNLPVEEIAQAGIEERGLQIHVPLPELPVEYSPDFAGEVVRDEAVGASLYGVELTVTGAEVTDGRIQVVGPDLEAGLLDEHPYALLIEVAGKDMQSDFESVLERQIETLVNDIHGVMHRGQRANTRLRVSRKSIEKGLRLRHLGEILHARFHNDFGNILSRVQVTFYTEPAAVEEIAAQAGRIYEQRDARLGDLTDEAVDVFYTCTLCQTIAAGHLCVISPEHPGVCGAQDWMDTRAAVSIRPVGPNREVKKEGLIDARLGRWESVNRIVRQESGGALTSYSLYSLMVDPGPACGDFECITAMLPIANGVMVMDFTYKDMTPSGMDWDMLYEMVGGGVPVPGFIGHSKRAVTSRKFISAEGGWRRIVWMNYTLREELRPALEALAAEEGVAGFVDMIATERDALTEEEILARMETVGHPALTLDPLM